MTKGELRSKVLARSGYGGLGAAAAGFVPWVDDMIEEAYQTVFELLPDDKQIKKWPWNTGVNQRWYDVPDDLDIDHVNYLAVYFQDTWLPLSRGIDMYHDSTYEEHEDFPLRWDLRFNPDADKTQIEMWPKIDGIYPIELEGQIRLNDLTNDNARLLYDDRLVLQYAMAMAKAHLNRPDAALAMNAFERRVKRIRGNFHVGKRYIRGEDSLDPLPRPTVTNPDLSDSSP
jgi:hypothetical protein